MTNSKESSVDVRARVSSEGQITIPSVVREALSIQEGDDVLFKVEGQQATIVRSPDLVRLAGWVSVPTAKRGTPWDEVLRRMHLARASARR